MTILREDKPKRIITIEPSSAAGFVLEWIGATFLVWVVGVFLVTLQAVLGMIGLFALGASHITAAWLLVLLAGITIGWLSGILQSTVIGQTGKFLPGWQTATLLGAVIGVPLALVANRLVGASGLGLVRTAEIGLWLPLLVLLLSTSLAQGVVLFVQRRPVGWWVLASLVSGLVYAVLHSIFWPIAVAAQASIQAAVLWHLLHTESRTEQNIEPIYAHR
ncbi:MAG: hypothetical protein KC496_03795 [Anaerolineae bacterium]|nr:hypothetical protein [Anaerolineae bacterium]